MKKVAIMFKSTALAALFTLGSISCDVAAAADQALVARGDYLARAGDCVACHTAPGGKPFAGGLPIVSDIGTIFSSNITPEKQHGIGSYTEEQFAAALREGIRGDGTHLYPAMPYPAYAKLSDEDVHALYTYFMNGVTADANQPPQTDLGFPYNQRWGMALWNLAFGPSSDPFKADPARSDEINRGAYLVEGLGHCGACHTPRGIGMQEKAYDASSDAFLGGADLNGWHAPELRAGGKATRGISSWTADDIADYLGKGRNRMAAGGGEMKSVVENSTAYMNDGDLHAIAAYLKSLPGSGAGQGGSARAAEATTAKLTAAKNLTPGERLYIDNCGACHFVDGKGAPEVFPALDGASIVNAENPIGLLQTILAGAQTPSTDRAPSIMPMPGFDKRLSDNDVAALATFVRGGWSNVAGAVRPEDVAKLRAALPSPDKKGDAPSH